MTGEEWQVISAYASRWWTSPAWDEVTDFAWSAKLRRHSATAVTAALETLSHEGRQFRPNTGEVMQILLEVGLDDAATPEQAWALVERAVAKVGRSVYAKDFHERHQAAVDWLAGEDRVVAAWAARRGLCGHGSLGAEPVRDPERGGAVRHTLKAEYSGHLERAQERVTLGRPAVPAEALYVRATGQLERGSGMKGLLERLRPAEQLPAGPDPADETSSPASDHDYIEGTR